MQFVKTLLNRARLSALAASAVGAGLFHLLDLPLPFLLGPMFGCLVAALAGAPLNGVRPLSRTVRI